jgi:hypothetical protein
MKVATFSFVRSFGCVDLNDGFVGPFDVFDEWHESAE